MKRLRGFSLIEVLLALAVGGIVLMAASSLLVTISQAWANRPATRDAFDAHVNGVAHFLTAVLEEAVTYEDSKKNSDIIGLGRPPSFSDRDEPLIKFYLPKAPRFFYDPLGIASRVHAYFQFDEGEGLYFLWYTDLQEMEKGEDGELQLADEEQLFRSQISPYFENVEYWYYGEEDDLPEDKKWYEEVNGLEYNSKTDRYRVPDYIKITFRLKEEDIDPKTITIAIKKNWPSGIEEEPL